MHFNNYKQSMSEMHVIAYIYHWSRNEVRSLSITERKQWCNLIVEQKKAENNSANAEFEEARSRSGANW